FADYSPVRENPVRRVDNFANPLYPPFEICESAVSLQKRGAWKDESRKFGGLAHKQILDDEKLQVPECLMHLLQIGIGLCNIVADDPEPLESAGDRGIPHIRRLHASFRRQGTSCHALMQRCECEIVQTLIAGKVGGQTPDIRGALHIVLPTQGIDASAGLTD